jgi:hypothetical protein
MLPVSLDCPFLVVPSVLSNVYLVVVHIVSPGAHEGCIINPYNFVQPYDIVENEAQNGYFKL